MHFRSALLIAGGFTASMAWTVPESHPDGVYHVSTDASGNSNHTLLAPLGSSFTPRGASSKRTTLKRTLQGSNSVTCTGTTLPSASANLVVQELGAYCTGGSTGGASVIVGGDVYAQSGNYVAYFCNFSTLQNTCYQDEVNDAMQNRISGACGSYSSGYDVVLDRAVQYGYDVFSYNFCSRGIEWHDSVKLPQK